MLASKIYLSNITFFETLYNIYLETIYKISSRRSWSVLQFIGFTVIAQRFERKCIWQGCEIPIQLSVLESFLSSNTIIVQTKPANIEVQIYTTKTGSFCIHIVLFNQRTRTRPQTFFHTLSSKTHSVNYPLYTLYFVIHS